MVENGMVGRYIAGATHLLRNMHRRSYHRRYHHGYHTADDD
jgi:hypothetical protein